MAFLTTYDPSVTIYGITVPLYILIALLGLFGVFVLGWGTRPSLQTRERGRDERRGYGRAGHPERRVLPLDWQGVSADTLARLELAYQEIQRRDSQAEQRAWRKDRLVQRLGLVILVLAGRPRLAGARPSSRSKPLSRPCR